MWGKVAGWFIGGIRQWGGAGHHPVTWSDTESMLENKNEGLGGREAAVQTGFQPIKRHVQEGKEPVFVFLRHASRELGMIRKAC
ncbi:hypothetical protein [Bartonella sp. AD13SXNS]|uniref:hypothetical protein n=1 Tax=Bartonella sp. AD13SXNS TaxID=3243462 RepID=UPI0035D05B36